MNKTYYLRKLEKQGIYWVYRYASFSMTTGMAEARPSVSWFLKNKSGTYVKMLNTQTFESREQGNEFYKSLLAQGYEKYEM